MSKDKRIKACPNAECSRNTEKYRYKATDKFCTICGSELVFVCADCFKKIADVDSDHVRCAYCEAKREDLKHNRKKKVASIKDGAAKTARDGLDALVNGGKTVVSAAGNAYEKVAKKTRGKGSEDDSQTTSGTPDIKKTAEKLIGSSKKIFGGKKTSMTDEETIKIPPEYGKVDRKVPNIPEFMKDAAAYAMDTGSANCFLLSCAVPEDVAMPFDNPQWVIDEQHKNMGENEGIIEVKNGKTASGKPYIYIIIKHRFGEEVPVVEYTLNINVRKERSIQFINSSFAEKGMTGLREAACLPVYAQAQHLGLDEAVKTWLQDPYDPDFKKGFLMNASEKADLDDQFPKHPLSAARSLVKYIIDNN